MKVSEELIQFIWESKMLAKHRLLTTENQNIEIHSFGYLNTSSGPDFLDAKISIGNTLFVGNVEIHVNGADWFSHQHHKDSLYNNVILHVCLHNGIETRRADQTLIPVVEIGNILPQKTLDQYKNFQTNKNWIPCQNSIHNISSIDLLSFKNRMTIARVEERCELIHKFLALHTNNWQQASFIMLVRSFGLPTNTLAFEELGSKIPFEIVVRLSDSIFQLEALFLGQAGLIPTGESSDAYTKALLLEYQFLKKKHNLKPVDSVIKFGRVRPMNFPTVRLIQLCSLFHHTKHIFSLIQDIPPLDHIHKMLQRPVSDYWHTHYTFGIESKQSSKLLSKDMTNRIVINAIVPIAFYYAKSIGNDNLTEKSISYLQSLPSEKNEIIVNWKNIGVHSRSADESQALIFLYKTYCSQKRCLQCGIGKKLLIL